VQTAARPWSPGRLAVGFPPEKPYGTASQFEDGITFPGDVNKSILRDGVTEQCWINVGVPFLPFDKVGDIANCCLRAAYARIIALQYVADFDRITEFFTTWLGPGVTVNHFPTAGLLPAMTIVHSAAYTIIISSGAADYQQLATQAWESGLGPTNQGTWSTLPLWMSTANTVADRLFAIGGNTTGPVLFVGHSYGAAVGSILLVRMREVSTTRELVLLTFGLPKPGDNRFNDQLDRIVSLFVVNNGDVVPHLPIDLTQSIWFEGLVSLVVRQLWGEWVAPGGALMQAVDGTKVQGQLPSLTYDVLLPLVVAWLLGLPLPQITAHQIETYLARTLMGCACPKWPLDQPSWDVLFPGPALGALELTRAAIAVDSIVLHPETSTVAAALLGLSAQPPPLPLGLVASIPSAGAIGVDAVNVLTDAIGVWPWDVATALIGIHDYRAELHPGGSIGLAAFPPALESSDDGVGLIAPQASVSTIGLTWIGEFEPWAVGAIGIGEVTPAAAGIGISGEVAGGFTVGIVAADVPAGSDVGLTFIEFQPWSDGSIGLDAATPAVGEVGLASPTPWPDGWAWVYLSPRQPAVGGSNLYITIEYYNGEFWLYAQDDNFGGGMDFVQVFLQLDTWYDLVIVDDGASISGTIDGTSATWSTSFQPTRTVCFFHEQNRLTEGNVPPAIDSLSVANVASGTVWTDNFVDADGTLITAHVPDLSPGGAGYTNPGSQKCEIVNNAAVIDNPGTGLDSTSVYFDSGLAPATSPITTVIRFKFTIPP